MAGKWEQEGVRGELGNDRVFVRNTETGQRGHVLTTPIFNDQDARDQEVGKAISEGKIENLTDPNS